MEMNYKGASLIYDDGTLEIKELPKIVNNIILEHLRKDLVKNECEVSVISMDISLCQREKVVIDIVNAFSTKGILVTLRISESKLEEFVIAELGEGKEDNPDSDSDDEIPESDIIDSMEEVFTQFIENIWNCGAKCVWNLTPLEKINGIFTDVGVALDRHDNGENVNMYLKVHLSEDEEKDLENTIQSYISEGGSSEKFCIFREEDKFMGVCEKSVAMNDKFAIYVLV